MNPGRYSVFLTTDGALCEDVRLEIGSKSNLCAVHVGCAIVDEDEAGVVVVEGCKSLGAVADAVHSGEAAVALKIALLSVSFFQYFLLFTSGSSRQTLLSMQPHAAMPMATSRFESAKPVDSSCSLSASPTYFITPVAVPPVMIQASGRCNGHVTEMHKIGQ